MRIFYADIDFKGDVFKGKKNKKIPARKLSKDYNDLRVFRKFIHQAVEFSNAWLIFRITF